MGRPILSVAAMFTVASLTLGIGCGKEQPGSTTPVAEQPAPPQEPVHDAQGRAIDPGTDMVIADGWELVAGNCTVCHSAKQFLRQRGTQQTWNYIIDWMQQTQGLWQFDPVTRTQIVGYLSANYGPTGEYRRAPIAATLMPPNPYASEIRKQVEDLRERGELPTGPTGK